MSKAAIETRSWPEIQAEWKEKTGYEGSVIKDSTLFGPLNDIGVPGFNFHANGITLVYLTELTVAPTNRTIVVSKRAAKWLARYRRLKWWLINGAEAAGE